MISPRKDNLPPCPFVMNNELYLDVLDNDISTKDYANKTLEEMKFTDVYTIDDKCEHWKKVQYILNRNSKGNTRVISPRTKKLLIRKVLVVKLKIKNT